MVTPTASPLGAKAPNPWAALAALCVGFFMILLDMTIVAVANPAIKDAFQTDMSNVIWVTSAYLLTYAVPLLIAGRLGDRFGPKNVYLAGLTVFTLASVWCGLADSIAMLIVARGVQGLGAALLTPQTMAVITRTFPADKRGAAMGFWGAVAGVATLVGPILGGVLVDGPGWEWIFLVNLPIGIIAFALAVWLVPALPTNTHKFDIPGVLLSAIGLSALVFGLQEGNTYDWNGWIWTLIVAGIVVLIGFLIYQGKNKNEPLLPLSLFADRNFTLANVAICAMGAAISAMVVPGFFYLQAVHGFSPTKSALVFAPMAVVTFFLAPIVGKVLVDRLHPAILPTAGFSLMAAGIVWFCQIMTPNAGLLEIMAPNALMGLASACIWAPLAATATRNLAPARAGAGAGVYNTTRQVGAVVGSAAMSALITARMTAHNMPTGSAEEQAGRVPEQFLLPFSEALAEANYLPAVILLFGIAASAFFVRGMPNPAPPQQHEPREPAAVGVAR